MQVNLLKFSFTNFAAQFSSQTLQFEDMFRPGPVLFTLQV